ncbi:MAG TPA: signal peptidase II [Nitrospirae bacterium]|nr:signal peptidase II [Nitrospirota bacterium]
MSFLLSRTLVILFSIVILVIDQVAKMVAVNFILPNQSIRVFTFLNLVNVRNTGAAFGLFQNLGNTIFIGISLVAILIILSLIIRSKEDSIALSLILGGALGNLTDRLRLGYVVDFIDLHLGRYHWPAFNLADSALSLGMVLLLFRLFWRTRKGV